MTSTVMGCGTNRKPTQIKWNELQGQIPPTWRHSVMWFDLFWNDHFAFQSHMVSSCNVSNANPHTCMIRRVNQLLTHHNSQPPGKSGSQSAGPDEGTAGRHFQLTEATWLGINWHISAACSIRQDGCYLESEVTEGIRLAKRSASTNLWLSVLKSFAISPPSFRSWRDEGGKV